MAAGAAAGDERAFEELVRRYEPQLRGYCVQLMRRVEDAEDALQEALTSAHRALLDAGPPEHPRAWLFAVARNRCLSLIRARPPQAADLDDADAAVTACAAEVALSRAELRALVEDLGRLDGDAREALVLTRLGDFNHRQVAAIVGCEPARVRSLVRQAQIELAAARLARELPCSEIRAELAELRRGGFRRAHIRRHLADCEPCRIFRRRLGEQEHALGVILPLPAAAEILAAGREAAEVGGLLTAGAGSSASGGAAGGAGGAGGLALGGAKLASTLAVGAALVGGGAAITVSPAGSQGPANDRGVETPAVDRVVAPVAASAHRPAGAPSRRADAPERSVDVASREPDGTEPPDPAPGATTLRAAPTEPDASLSRATAESSPPEPDRGGSRTGKSGGFDGGGGETWDDSGGPAPDAPQPPEPDESGPRPEVPPPSGDDPQPQPEEGAGAGGETAD